MVFKSVRFVAIYLNQQKSTEISCSKSKRSIDMFLQKEHVWQLAAIWVRSNSLLIRYVSSRYYPCIAGNAKDLEGEALLVAFQVLNDLLQEGKELDLMHQHFCVIFRYRCMQLARGVYTVSYNPEILTVAEEDDSQNHNEVDHQIIKTALSALTARQRRVASWILEQPYPVLTSDVAEQFQVTTRGVRKLLKNAIERIEKRGYQRICDSLPTAS